jgi:hypothetical protein
MSGCLAWGALDTELEDDGAAVAGAFGGFHGIQAGREHGNQSIGRQRIQSITADSGLAPERADQTPLEASG